MNNGRESNKDLGREAQYSAERAGSQRPRTRSELERTDPRVRADPWNSRPLRLCHHQQQQQIKDVLDSGPSSQHDVRMLCYPQAVACQIFPVKQMGDLTQLPPCKEAILRCEILLVPDPTCDRVSKTAFHTMPCHAKENSERRRLGFPAIPHRALARDPSTLGRLFQFTENGGRVANAQVSCVIMFGKRKEQKRRLSFDVAPNACLENPRPET